MCTRAIDESDLMVKKAFITGITGQDGSYLSELLLSKKYDVYGLVLECDTDGVKRLSTKDDVTLLKGDLTDPDSIRCAVKECEPDEIYNLAAPTFVPSSMKDPVTVTEIGALGAMRVMDAAIRTVPHARMFQASSSEIFAGTSVSPQNERTPMAPVTPYGSAKAFATYAAAYYRRQLGLSVSCGIFYNHESERRPPNFVSRKITLGVARIAYGLQKKIELGSLKSRRDWGYAPEYVDAAWRMLQKKPDDYIIATGELHSVRELLEEACRVAGIDFSANIIKTNKKFLRSADYSHLRGNAAKARRALGWTPKTRFKKLVRIMVESDMKLAESETKTRKEKC
jgi:GDPmannose 4,6-dehydratase